MRYSILILLLHLFLNGFSQTGINKKILDSELRRFEAMVEKDTATLQTLLADDMLYVHSNSLKEDKRQHLAAIRTGTLVYEKMTRESAQVRRYGKIAVVNGAIKVSGMLNKANFEISLFYTAIYKKKKKNWQLVNWQSTRIP